MPGSGAVIDELATLVKVSLVKPSRLAPPSHGSPTVPVDALVARTSWLADRPPSRPELDAVSALLACVALPADPALVAEDADVAKEAFATTVVVASF
jgi:hypothetical protein